MNENKEIQMTLVVAQWERTKWQEAADMEISWSPTQQFIEEVKNVLPCRSGLFTSLLRKVGSTIVQVHLVDALGQ